MFFKSGHIALWNTLLERLLRLRQMCDHWTLCRKKGMEKHRKELDELLCAASGNPAESQLSELLRLSLQAKIACGICNEPLDDECGPVIIPCAHVFCKPCLLTRFQDMVSCPVCNNTYSTTSITELESVPSSTYEVPAKSDHSSKTQALLSIVKERLRNKGSKIVIFSQWTSFLNIVSRQLDEEGVGHTRIDGTMSTTERDEAVKALQGDSNVRVMLASLRAAGVGISLVAADTAILADSCTSESPHPLRTLLLTRSRVGPGYRGAGGRQSAPTGPDAAHKGLQARHQGRRRGRRDSDPGSKEGAGGDGVPGGV